MVVEQLCTLISQFHVRAERASVTSMQSESQNSESHRGKFAGFNKF